MKVFFLYFSGTGNTDYIAHYLARGILRNLSHSSIEIDFRSIEWQPAESVIDFDLLVVGFPVYAGDSPKLVQDYLVRLPSGKARGVYIFCTKGAFAANSVRHNLQRLAANGYIPLGGGSVLMPGTDGLSMVSKNSLMAHKALEKDFDHLKDADRLVDEIASISSELQDGCPVETLRQSLPSRSGPSFLDRIWTFLYTITENYARSRLDADEQCTGCGICSQICPLGSIEMFNGHPRFADNCALCMRCIHACPQEAIQIGKLTSGKFRWKGPKGDFNPLRMQPREKNSLLVG
jgi:ferredoxin